MGEPDFAALAASLKQASEETFKEIVAYFRTKFHGIAGTRFDQLLKQLGSDDFANSLVPLPSIKNSHRAEIMGRWLSEARRGNQPAFRALLLKWLWIHDREMFALYEDFLRSSPEATLEQDRPINAELRPTRTRQLVEHGPKKQPAPKDAKIPRRDTFEDSKIISKNKLYVRELINVLAKIASDSGITTK